MGIKFSEIDEGSSVILRIRANNKTLELNATFIKIITEKSAIIDIDHESRLSFNNVFVDLIHEEKREMPAIWHNVKISGYQANYLVESPSDGINLNRRGFFRLGISQRATMKKSTGEPMQVIVRDISLSGFALTDNKNELNLRVGDQVHVSFDDAGHIIKLVGKVARIEPREGSIIYGLSICNQCNELSSYISVKQRQQSFGANKPLRKK